MPGFDGDWWLRTLDEAASLGPDHLSCYELTIHDGTPFGRRRDAGRLRETGEDERAANFVATHRRLADLGYDGYEVSNFARTETDRSRHNRKYRRHEPYLGLGPSSHSFAGRSRWWNVAPWRDWSAAVERGDSSVGRSRGADPGSIAAGSRDDGASPAIRHRLCRSQAAVRGRPAVRERREYRSLAERGLARSDRLPTDADPRRHGSGRPPGGGMGLRTQWTVRLKAAVCLPHACRRRRKRSGRRPLPGKTVARANWSRAMHNALKKIAAE